MNLSRMHLQVIRRFVFFVAFLSLFAGIVLFIICYFPIFVSLKLDTSAVKHWPGQAYVAPVPSYFRNRLIKGLFPIVSDSLEIPEASHLQLFENTTPLGPPHSLHTDIEEKGRGRFSNWNGYLVFSASDNSDPMTNGRIYRVRYPLLPSWWLPFVLLMLGYGGLWAFVRTCDKSQGVWGKIDKVLAKVSGVVCSLPKPSNQRYWLLATAIILWLYSNAVFFLLLPAPSISPDSGSYIGWSMFRTLGYPAVLDFYHVFFHTWNYLPIFQLNLVLLGVFTLCYAIVRLTRSYLWGWLFLVMVNCVAGAMLLNAADMLTEGVFAGFVMLHLACMYLFLNGSRAYVGLLAGLSLAAAILIKSVATVFLGPLLLFLLFLPGRRMTVLALIFCPALLGWLAPSAYNYVQQGVFDSSVAGGYALGGYAAPWIHPRPGSAYSKEAKVIEQRLQPILAKRPAHFHSMSEYYEYVVNEYNVMLWGNIVPALVACETHFCATPDHTCQWRGYKVGCPCLVRLDRVLLILSEQVIFSEPRLYGYLVFVNYVFMWKSFFDTTPDFLDGARDKALSLPADYQSLPNNGRQLSLPSVSPESIALRVIKASSVRISGLKTALDFLVLRKNLPFDRLFASMNYSGFALGVGLAAIGLLTCLLVFGLRWIPPAARALCYTGLVINAYFLGTALAQPALYRYAQPLQGVEIALLVMSACLVVKTGVYLVHHHRMKVAALAAGVLETAGHTNDT